MASGQVLKALLGKRVCDPGIHRPGKARCFGPPLTLSYPILFYPVLFYFLLCSIRFSILFYFLFYSLSYSILFYPILFDFLFYSILKQSCPPQRLSLVDQYHHVVELKLCKCDLVLHSEAPEL